MAISGATGSAALGGAAAGASFGPVGMAIGAAAGIGFQLWGASESASASKKQNEAQKAAIAIEQNMEKVRRQAMELSADRMRRENIRRLQQAQAMGLVAAVSQGAQFGSGLAGSKGQQRGQAAWNELGINQNLYLGRNMFDLNAQLSEQKIAMADAQMGMQTGAALSSLGGGIMNNLGAIGRLSSGFGPGSNSPAPFGTASSQAIY